MVFAEVLFSYVESFTFRRRILGIITESALSACDYSLPSNFWDETIKITCFGESAEEVSMVTMISMNYEMFDLN